MAEEEKRTYPSIASRNWWTLRKRFKSTIPREVTSSYLATALSMNEESARKNILPSLKLVGLLDKDGKPTDLAAKWRDDNQYKEVCRVIREGVYTTELLDLAPAESADKTTVQNWFANHTKLGESSVSKLTSFYLLLCQADVSQESEALSSLPEKGKPASIRNVKPAKAAEPVKQTIERENDAGQGETKPRYNPNYKLESAININIQIHISSSASSQQIDDIFSSMAKHLKDLHTGSE